MATSCEIIVYEIKAAKEKITNFVRDFIKSSYLLTR